MRLEKEANFGQRPDLGRLVAAERKSEEARKQRRRQKKHEQKRRTLGDADDADVTKKRCNQAIDKLPERQRPQNLILGLNILDYFICCHEVLLVLSSPM